MSLTAKVTVSLPRELAERVDDLVAAEAAPSRSAVVAAAVREYLAAHGWTEARIEEGYAAVAAACGPEDEEFVQASELLAGALCRE